MICMQSATTMEDLEEVTIQLTAKMQVNGTISMIVLAEVYHRQALVALELIFSSIREEIDLML